MWSIPLSEPKAPIGPIICKTMVVALYLNEHNVIKNDNYLSRFNILVVSSALINLGTHFSVILGLRPNLHLCEGDNFACVT